MEYVSHKLTIVLYAAVMLCFFHTVLFQVSGLEKNYLLTGFWVSFAILLFLTMFCINQKFAPWLLRCSDHIKKEKIKEKAKAGIAQMEDFSRVGSVVIKDKQQWIGLIFRNAVKMTCLYALPAVAIFAVTGERLPLSVLECLAFSSVMQLLIGVIPSSGGTGSTELVFLMLFGSMTEKSVCGAAMILYRMATYYLPFLISIPLLFFGKRSTEA